MAEKKVVINPSWCKGCGICVAFCPKNVLGLRGEKAVLVKPEDCTLCGLCEMRCPDFAVYLSEVDDNEQK